MVLSLEDLGKRHKRLLSFSESPRFKEPVQPLWKML